MILYLSLRLPLSPLGGGLESLRNPSPLGEGARLLSFIPDLLTPLKGRRGARVASLQ